MQHSRTNHQVERASNLPDALDRELMQLEVLKIVLALKIARVAQARVADVDRGDPRIRLAERIPGCLRRAADGHENLLICARALVRPRQVELRAATLRIRI